MRNYWAEFLLAAENGTARTVYEDGSTYGVYAGPNGRREHWHLCYGDRRESYATDGFSHPDGNGSVLRIPALSSGVQG